MANRRLLTVIFVGVFAVLLGGYAAAFAFASDRLPSGTSIGGVGVGGLSPEKAELKLEKEFDGAQTRDIVVRVSGETFPIKPQQAGLSFDLPASVAQAPAGSSWNPADMWEQITGGADYELITEQSGDGLAKALSTISKKVGKAPVEGGVSFTAKGVAKADYPTPGEGINEARAEELVLEAFPVLKGEERIDLDVEDIEADISRSEVDRALEEFANVAMSGPVTYKFDDQQVQLAPRQFARTLSMKAKDGRLVPKLRRKEFIEVFKNANVAVDGQPVDARFEIVNNAPRVVPSQPGVEVDVDKVADGFLDLVGATSAKKRTSKVGTVVAKPELTTKEARQLGVKELVSEFTTSYPHADYRNTNIGRGADLINNTLLEPGEIFSLNGIVGQRTSANGFTEGFIISDGILKEDLGGGVSQVATTTYNAAYFAGLEDVEHKAHSFYIDRYPVGREATVAWPVLDLKFKNNTEYGVLVTAQQVDSAPGGTGSITVKLWSTKVWDIESITGSRYNFTDPETRKLSGDDCVTNEGYGGFSINDTREFRRPGTNALVKSEKQTTVYTPSDTVECEG